MTSREIGAANSGYAPEKPLVDRLAHSYGSSSNWPGSQKTAVNMMSRLCMLAEGPAAFESTAFVDC